MGAITEREYRKIVNENDYKSLEKPYWLENEDQHKKRLKLEERLERQFRESHLSNYYILVPNTKLENEPFWYVWDYGVFTIKSHKLVAVVDIYDDNFYIDKCDYIEFCIPALEAGCSLNAVLTEGIEVLQRSIFENYVDVSYFKIYPDHFIDSLEYMIKCILPHYEEYVQRMYNLSRSIDFPFPKYSEKELIESFEQLCNMDCDNKNIALNTRLGDKLIQHFHPSIWYAHRAGELSPYEAWQDNDIMMKVIRNRVIFQPYLNPSKMLQGINITKKAPKVSVFSAARAKLIINKFLDDFDTIFDPFSGYSGRFLGTVSLGKRYIGQDINSQHVNESINILIFLRSHFSNINAHIMQRDIFASIGEYSCLFTCSPYSDKEIWKGTPEKFLTCDQWIDECLQRFNCKRYVFVVDKTNKYKDNIVNAINNKSHFGLNNEYIILINRN